MLILLNTLRHSGTRSITETWLSIKHPEEEQTRLNSIEMHWKLLVEFSYNSHRILCF